MSDPEAENPSWAVNELKAAVEEHVHFFGG